MPFDVYLTISGLCMYVPDGEGSNAVMHVLMPAHGPPTGGGHAHDGHAPHHALLMYDRQYHAAGEVPEDGNPCVAFPIGGHAISVRGRQALGKPQVEAVVPELDASVNFAGVPRACVDFPLDDRVHARLELRGIGRTVAYTGLSLTHKVPLCLTPIGSDCNAPSARPPRLMAEHVHWSLGRYDGDDVGLDTLLTAVPEIEAFRDVRLRPRNGVVRLRVAYVIESVIAPMCAGNESPMDPAAASHFPMYYRLSSEQIGPPYTPQLPPKAPKKFGFLHPSSACVPSIGRFAAG